MDDKNAQETGEALAFITQKLNLVLGNTKQMVSEAEDNGEEVEKAKQELDEAQKQLKSLQKDLVKAFKM